MIRRRSQSPARRVPGGQDPPCTEVGNSTHRRLLPEPPSLGRDGTHRSEAEGGSSLTHSLVALTAGPRRAPPRLLRCRVPCAVIGHSLEVDNIIATTAMEGVTPDESVIDDLGKVEPGERSADEIVDDRISRLRSHTSRV